MADAAPLLTRRAVDIATGPSTSTTTTRDTTDTQVDGLETRLSSHQQEVTMTLHFRTIAFPCLPYIAIQVYGFDMSVIKEIAYTEPLVDVVDGKAVISRRAAAGAWGVVRAR